MKYNNTKTVVEGVKFDSKKEAQRYTMLKGMEKIGLIFHLKLQPKYLLQDSFTKNGKKHRSITYIADFEYIDDGEMVVEDVKGYKTETFKLKRKLFEYKYPELNLRIT